MLSEAAYLVAPRLTDAWMNTLYRVSQRGASAASLREVAQGPSAK
jgi:hypothetical protein